MKKEEIVEVVSSLCHSQALITIVNNEEEEGFLGRSCQGHGLFPVP